LLIVPTTAIGTEPVRGQSPGSGPGRTASGVRWPHSSRTSSVAAGRTRSASVHWGSRSAAPVSPRPGN
jgi:hypothetical protein